MEYVFRIHDSNEPGATRPTPAANVNGWSQTAHIQGALLSNIVLGQESRKSETSIPSIFARLRMYKGAFNIMKGATINQIREININTKRISECWDMLEFLFQHGEDTHLIVRSWNFAQQVGALLNSPSEGHHKLAAVINDERMDISDVSSIYLFYWKDSTSQNITNESEVLIGATSPYTLTYISPNWFRKAENNGWNHFSRLKGGRLFDRASICPLCDRNDSFKKMVYALYMAYSDSLNNLCPDFASYINTCWNNDQGNFPGLAQRYGMNPNAFTTDFPSIRDEKGGVIGIFGNNISIPIPYSKIDVADSDYIMRPTVAMPPSATPLVLNHSGIQGARYIGDDAWSPVRCVINEAYVRTTIIPNRVLPGGYGIRHPFVSITDFVEDKLLKSREIDGTRFLTCKRDASSFLLPLKPKFFEYFTINDVLENRIVAFRGGKDIHLVEMADEPNNAVSITLNIPVKANNSNGYIELKKIYQSSDIVNLPLHFSLGVHAFYNVVGNPNMNEYAFMACGNDISLNFYDIKDGNISEVTYEKSRVPRTCRDQVFDETNYYTVHAQAFNCIQLTYGFQNTSLLALIIPKLKQVDPDAAIKKFTFAVDFGTSNTHIAYYDTQDKTPRNFIVGPEDQQTIFISKEEGAMLPFFEREFAPVRIGNDNYATYPSRTAVCESPGFNGNAQLFGNISIGYTIDSEKTTVTQKFNTDLKWALENAPGDAVWTARVRAYFKQILWMLKNKSLLNDGSANFDVLLTFPAAMTVATRNIYIGLWNTVKNDLGISGCNIKYSADTSESVAPYYDLVQTIVGNSFLNIDIGGCTSDFLYVIKDNAGAISRCLYSSVKFAADDLWGDGQLALEIHNKDNGFYDYLMHKIAAQANAFAPVLLNQMYSVENIMQKSSDMMGFLFKHDAEFNISNMIRANDNLFTLIFVHYAAIIYYVSKILNRYDIDIPEYISLTGLGSKYVNIISSQESDVKDFTKLLVENFTGKECPAGFKIYMQSDRKEITARGALKSQLLVGPGAAALRVNNLQQIVEHCLDDNKTMTYEQAKTDAVQEEVLKSFDHFIDLLNQNWFKNYLHDKFNIVIPVKLLDKFKALGRTSYKNLCACVPAVNNGVEVNESLFFWPLKNVFYELSKQVNNTKQAEGHIAKGKR